MADSTLITANPALRADAESVRSLKLNIFYAVGGMGLFQACQFGMIVLLAKFAPAEVLGQVRLSAALATPVIMFCALELRGALVADAAGEFSFGTYRALRNLTMAVAAVFLLPLLAWYTPAGQRLAFTVILVGMAASKLVISLAEIGWGLFQKRERLDLVATSAMLRGAVLIGAFATLVPLYWYLGEHGVISRERVVEGAALALTIYVLASVLILILYDRPRVRNRADYDPSWSWSGVWRLLQHTFPLGIVAFTLYLTNSVPELVLGAQVGGTAALGFFGALATVTIAGNLLIFQAANAAANRLATYYQIDLSRFLELAGKLLALAVATGALLIVATWTLGEPLLRLLYRTDYAGYVDEFKIIVIAQCLALLTTVFGVVTTQMRLFWLQVPAQVIVLGVTVAAALWFIPKAENLVAGAAWTVMARSVVHVVLYAGCVAAGILLRPRVLARRPSLAQVLAAEPEGGVENW